jgi:hypothetical protein
MRELLDTQLFSAHILGLASLWLSRVSEGGQRGGGGRGKRKSWRKGGRDGGTEGRRDGRRVGE